MHDGDVQFVHFFREENNPWTNVIHVRERPRRSISQPFFQGFQILYWKKDPFSHPHISRFHAQNQSMVAGRPPRLFRWNSECVEKRLSLSGGERLTLHYSGIFSWRGLTSHRVKGRKMIYWEKWYLEAHTWNVANLACLALLNWFSGSRFGDVKEYWCFFCAVPCTK